MRRRLAYVAATFGLACLVLLVVDVAMSDSSPAELPAPPIVAEWVVPRDQEKAKVEDARRYDDGMQLPPGAHLTPPSECRPYPPLRPPLRPFMHRGPVRRIMVRVWRFVFCW